MKPGGEKKMTVEEFIDYSVSKNSMDFTIPYLNQILQLHGFRKLHKAQKVATTTDPETAFDFNKFVEIERKFKIVGEAVDALELLDLSRSTLKQTGISSSSSSLTLHEVITDIEALKWQECCLTSLQIINSDQVSRSVSVTKPKQKSNKRKKVTMMKKKSLKFGHEDDDDDDETMMVQVLSKMYKKKKEKKSIRAVNEAAAISSIVS